MTDSRLKKRLASNFGANAYGQLVTTFVQLLSVPLFLYYWGVDLYGEWLILSAIPTYLNLSEMGFATAAANSMSISMSKNNRLDTLSVYQSTWVFVSSISILIFGLFIVAIYYLPLVEIFSLEHISKDELTSTLVILILYTFIGLQWGMFNAAYRAVGRYAFITTSWHTTRLTEWISACIVLMFDGGVLAVAMAFLVIRIAAYFVVWYFLHLHSPWLRLGINKASIIVVRELFKPSFAFMAFPAGIAISMQGAVIVVGITLGGAAVAIFTTYRTLTRLLVQMVTILNQSVWPEMTTAFARNDLVLVRKLYQKSTFLSFWVTLLGGLFLGVLGQWILGFWTNNTIVGHETLLLLMLAAVSINVLWQPSWVLLMSINSHQVIAVYFVLFSILSVILVAFLSSLMGLNGIGAALFLVELPMLFIVVSQALKLVQSRWSKYIKGAVGVK